MKQLGIALALILLVTQIALCAGVQAPTGVSALQTGSTPQASNWNTSIVGTYTYVNNNICSALNSLTAKGDLYGYTGATISPIAVGSNNKVLQANSAIATGANWATYSGATPLTTKGDVCVGDGTSINRLAVGTNGYALGADSTAANGVAWVDLSTSGIYPKGAIIAWSPTGAGTTTIPSGWTVCDGTSSTPNLIGRFVLGTRPNGSAASPSSGGYGAATVDGNGATGAATHAHTFSASGGPVSNAGNANSGVQAGTGSTVSAYTHTHSIPAMGAASAVGSSQMASYALIYIMKS